MKNGNSGKKPTYAGSVKNTGAQKVDALFKTNTKSKTVAKTGNDLRTGK